MSKANNKLKAYVVAQTTSHMDKKEKSWIDNTKAFGGACGGICYSNKPYMNSYVTDYDKALKRFNEVVGNRKHHSVGEHCSVTIVFENIPKIVAMYLNNLNVYVTSEKSGRYTKMNGSSEIEQVKYDKWLEKFKTLLKTQYNNLDDKTIEKLAMENARYFLDVFTPTTMAYTTNIVQWNYIVSWCERFEPKDYINNQEFFSKLKEAFIRLVDTIKPLVSIKEIDNFKKRCDLDLIGNWRVKNFSNSKTSISGNIYPIYSHIGKMSFACLGQAQRHRTLDYNANFLSEVEFYIPKIIKDFNETSLENSLQSEWLNDMQEIYNSGIIPQALLLCVEESGKLNHFYSKCKERICNRAQEEIKLYTIDTSNKLLDLLKEKELEEIIKTNYKLNKTNGDYIPKMKGQYFACNEPCYWSCKID